MKSSEHDRGRVMELPERLELERKVRETSNWLIGKMQTLTPQLDVIIKEKPRGPAIGKSQIHNLLRATKTAAGIGELNLLIGYQTGRDDNYRGWANRDKNSGKTFGEKLQAILKEIDDMAAKRSNTSSEQVELSLKMTERLLVYLYWHYTYSVSAQIRKQEENNGSYSNKSNDRNGRRGK